MWGAALLLLVLYLAPVLVSFCLPDPRGGVPWHQARRDPTGLSPDPAATQEAVIQVFAAPAVSWRGIFSVHTWVVVKLKRPPKTPDRVYPVVKNQEYDRVYDWEYRPG